MNIEDFNAQISLFLTKEDNRRFIKIKCEKNDTVVTSSRSEIALIFQMPAVPDVNDKLLTVYTKTKDLCFLLEIIQTIECDLFIELTIKDSSFVSIKYFVESPFIEINYKDIKINEVKEAKTYQYIVKPIHSK